MTVPSRAKGGYIVGPAYDWGFFILSPLLAVLIGYLIVRFDLSRFRVEATDDAGQAIGAIALPMLVSQAFTHAHLFIVFFRSHGNRQIFRLYPWRFTAVPLLLLVAACALPWVFVGLSVLVVWWDVYHSSLQTFGLGRIYDQRHGNDLKLGRRADYIFNLVIYAGPVLAGANFAAHMTSFTKFGYVDGQFMVAFYEAVMQRSEAVRWAVVGLGCALTVGYLAYYAWLRLRRGYRIPLPKLALFLSTAAVSVVVWGFNPLGYAFLIMNFFHALQYFGIVWWSEKKNLTSLVRWQAAAFVLLVGVGALYGYWRVHKPEDFARFGFVIALGNVVSLMHFWYDGFIWSVRKGQV